LTDGYFAIGCCKGGELNSDGVAARCDRENVRAVEVGRSDGRDLVAGSRGDGRAWQRHLATRHGAVHPARTIRKGRRRLLGFNELPRSNRQGQGSRESDAEGRGVLTRDSQEH